VVTKDFNVVSDSDFYFIIAEYFSVIIINISNRDFYVIITANITINVATNVSDRDFYIVVAINVTKVFFYYC
jgi:hypothetical protein